MRADAKLRQRVKASGSSAASRNATSPRRDELGLPIADRGGRAEAVPSALIELAEPARDKCALPRDRQDERTLPALRPHLIPSEPEKLRFGLRMLGAPAI